MGQPFLNAKIIPSEECRDIPSSPRDKSVHPGEGALQPGACLPRALPWEGKVF